jgi:hypothetical protein
MVIERNQHLDARSLQVKSVPEMIMATALQHMNCVLSYSNWKVDWRQWERVCQRERRSR